MLEKLKNKIPKKEAEKRSKAFLKAGKYIETASANGGLNAVASVSFNVKGSPKERIDIEIRKGLAFTPEN